MQFYYCFCSACRLFLFTVSEFRLAAGICLLFLWFGLSPVFHLCFICWYEPPILAITVICGLPILFFWLLFLLPLFILGFFPSVFFFENENLSLAWIREISSTCNLARFFFCISKVFFNIYIFSVLVFFWCLVKLIVSAVYLVILFVA